MSHEAVPTGEVSAHLLDEVTGVVRDRAAAFAHEVEMLIGVGKLPAGGSPLPQP